MLKLSNFSKQALFWLCKSQSVLLDCSGPFSISCLELFVHLVEFILNLEYGLSFFQLGFLKLDSE